MGCHGRSYMRKIWKCGLWNKAFTVRFWHFKLLKGEGGATPSTLPMDPPVTEVCKEHTRKHQV